MGRIYVLMIVSFDMMLVGHVTVCWCWYPLWVARRAMECTMIHLSDGNTRGQRICAITSLLAMWSLCLITLFRAETLSLWHTRGMNVRVHHSSMQHAYNHGSYILNHVKWLGRRSQGTFMDFSGKGMIDVYAIRRSPSYLAQASQTRYHSLNANA